MMMIARKLLDSFMEALSQAERDRIYDLAMEDFDAAMAALSNRYEEIYRDYPTGFVAAFLQQHLRDRVFQRKKVRDINAA